MRKHISGVAYLLVILALFILSSHQITATTYIQENFNRADANLTVSPTANNGKNWTTIAGATKPYIFQNIGYWSDTGTNPSAYLQLSKTMANKTELCLDVWSQMSTTTNANIEYYQNSTRLVRIDFINTEKIRAWTGSSLLNVYNYTSFVWYTLCLIQNNNSYYNLTINNNFIGSYKNYNSNTGYINKLWFEGSGSIIVRFDNIIMDDGLCEENITSTLLSNTSIRECMYYGTPYFSWQTFRSLTYNYQDENLCNGTYPYNETTQHYYACPTCVTEIENITSSWQNLTECYSNSTLYASRWVYRYDDNECKYYNVSNPPDNYSLYNETTNTTYYEWRNCDYECVSNLSSTYSAWNNSTSCLSNCTTEQERWYYTIDLNNCTSPSNITQHRWVECSEGNCATPEGCCPEDYNDLFFIIEILLIIGVLYGVERFYNDDGLTVVKSMMMLSIIFIVTGGMHVYGIESVLLNIFTILNILLAIFIIYLKLDLEIRK